MEQYIIYKDEMLGEGVDGKIYKAKFKHQEIVVKVMDNQFDKEGLKNFIEVNKIASNKGFGPTIYDIYVKDNLIYIFMEQLDGTIDDYIKQRLITSQSLNSILEEVKNKIKVLHQKLIEEKITIEENISDNYMFKGDIIKRIDFTKSHIKDKLTNNDLKKYKFIHIANPISNNLEKLFLV